MLALLNTLENWMWLTGALIGAAILHILTVLYLAERTEHRGITALDRVTAINEMVALPATTPDDQVLPFMAPDVRYAICRYDLSEGPVTVRTAFGDGTWSIALYNRTGSNFYGISSAELQRREIELLLAPSSEGGTASLPISKEVVATNITVNVPEKQGIAIIRAPLLGNAYVAETEQILAQSRCEPVAKGEKRDAAGG